MGVQCGLSAPSPLRPLCVGAYYMHLFLPNEAIPSTVLPGCPGESLGTSDARESMEFSTGPVCRTAPRT